MAQNTLRSIIPRSAYRSQHLGVQSANLKSLHVRCRQGRYLASNSQTVEFLPSFQLVRVSFYMATQVYTGARQLHDVPPPQSLHLTIHTNVYHFKHQPSRGEVNSILDNLFHNSAARPMRRAISTRHTVCEPGGRNAI